MPETRRRQLMSDSCEAGTKSNATEIVQMPESRDQKPPAEKAIPNTLAKYVHELW